MAAGNIHNLADLALSKEPHELDLTLLLQNSEGRQKAALEQLYNLLKQTVAAACDRLTIEPDGSCWRLRFFAADINFEQIEYDSGRWQQLLETLIPQLWPQFSATIESRTLLALIDGKRYQVLVKRLSSIDGHMMQLTIERWQPVAKTLNDLQLPATVDKRLRRWTEQTGAWLTIAGPSSRLNTHVQLAAIQAMSSPERRILHLARDHRYSLPRVNQISLAAVKERHQQIIWQQALSMGFDAIALDSVRDHWLKSLASASDATPSVVHTVNAANTSRAMQRLQALNMSSYQYMQSHTALLMLYPARLLCERCKSPDNNTLKYQSWLDSWHVPDNSIESWLRTTEKPFMNATGCNTCNDTGKAAWTTIYEWLEFNSEMASAVTDDSWQTATSLIHLQQSVVQSVFKLARQGAISLTEAKRVLDPITH